MTQPLDAKEGFSQALLPLANNLFIEALTFAQIVGADPKPDMLRRYDNRFRLIIKVLKLLEESIGLKFSDKLPYVYNDTSWSVNSPGGYTEASGPTPHEVLTTLHTLMGSVKHSDLRFPKKHVSRAINFVHRQYGKEAAIDYTLDLIWYGYLPYDLTAVTFLRTALRDTRTLDMRLRLRLSYAEVCNQRITNRLTSLIEQTLASVEPDQFLVNRIRLSRLAWCLIRLGLAEDRKNPPVSVISLISQLEEIKADVVAQQISFHSEGTVSSILRLGSGVLSLVRDDPAKFARIQSSRALMPSALADNLIGGDHILPNQWQDFSYRVINPVAVFCGCDLTRLKAKIHSTSFNPIPSDSDLAELQRTQLSLASSENPAQIVLAVDEYPWAGGLRVRLADCLLLFEQPGEALPQAIIGLHLGLGTAKNWDVLAEILDRLQHTREAEQARALGRILSDLGGEPDTGGNNDIALAQQADEPTHKPIPILKWTLTNCEQALGRIHPDTMIACNDLVSAYMAAGRAEEAIPLLKRTLADHKQVLGEAHPETLAVSNRLGTLYQAAGRSNDAVPLLEQTAVRSERALGERHPATLAAYRSLIAARNDLASFKRSIYHTDEAIVLLKKNTEDSVRIFGETDPDTLESFDNLTAIIKPRDR